MNTVKINNEINLTFPDSFKEMGEEELTRYFSSPNNRWGAYDADEHIILSVSWKKAGFLSSDPEIALFDIESRMRRDLLNYQQITSFKTKVASKKAYGVRFEYRVNDSCRVHVGDIIVFKGKKCFYTIYYITRKANAAAARPALKEILDSVTIG